MPPSFYLSLAGVGLFVLATRLMRRGAERSPNITSIWRGGSAVSKVALLIWWIAILLVLASVILLVV